MSTMHKAFMEEVDKIPQLFLTQLVSDKLEEKGFTDSPNLAEALVEHILSGKGELFTWDDGKSSDEPVRELDLTFTDEDIEKFEEEISRFLKDDLPGVIKEAAESSAKILLKALKNNWPEVDEYEAVLQFEFRERLEERWGKAFDLLRMLLTIALEIGDEAYKRQRKSRARKNRTLRSVLLRLHARSCQVTAEIITLMENGYADGAMARWRTLYEIGVVATVISDGGEVIAERYVEHEVIETKAEMDEFDRCYSALGYKPISAREKRQVEKAYDAAIQKFGKGFGSPYGWAASHLNKKKPILRDLEVSATRSYMRSYYKLASQNVHAGTKSIFYRLSFLGDQTDIIAGASNAGFEEPGQNAALTLTQITALLNDGRMSKIDVMVELKTLLLLCDEISRAFILAARKLSKDEAALVKKQK